MSYPKPTNKDVRDDVSPRLGTRGRRRLLPKASYKIPPKIDRIIKNKETIKRIKPSGTVESIVSNNSVVDQRGVGEWRNHGKIMRAQMIIKDEATGGGSSFVLSDNCDIHDYYNVADKVFDKFMKTEVKTYSELTECYLIGNRLVKFLSTILPTHHDYLDKGLELVHKRNMSQALLVRLLQSLEHLALMIDEEEYRNYILRHLSDERDSFFSDSREGEYPDDIKKVERVDSISSIYTTPPRRNKKNKKSNAIVLNGMARVKVDDTESSQNDFSIQSSVLTSDFHSLDDSKCEDLHINISDSSSFEPEIRLLKEINFVESSESSTIDRLENVSKEWEFDFSQHENSFDDRDISNITFLNSSGSNAESFDNQVFKKKNEKEIREEADFMSGKSDDGASLQLKFNRMRSFSTRKQLSPSTNECKRSVPKTSSYMIWNTDEVYKSLDDIEMKERLETKENEEWKELIHMEPKQIGSNKSSTFLELRDDTFMRTADRETNNITPDKSDHMQDEWGFIIAPLDMSSNQTNSHGYASLRNNSEDKLLFKNRRRQLERFRGCVKFLVM